MIRVVLDTHIIVSALLQQVAAVRYLCRGFLLPDKKIVAACPK